MFGGNTRQTNCRIDPKIINLSKRELDESEIELLKKGLKFTPTPPVNHQELAEDIQTFCRKVRLVEFFADKNKNDDDESLVRNKSNFIPPSGRNTHLDSYIKGYLVFILQLTFVMLA